MEKSNEKMKLIEVLNEIDTWILEHKTKFFEKIGESVPIEIRAIIGRKDINENQKIEGIRLINEFHHEMNNIKQSLVLTAGTKYKISENYSYIKSMASRNDKLISSEIAFCIQRAYRVMNHQSIQRNEKYEIEPSIYRLFEDKNFDEQITNIIGEETLNNLEGFIAGYFYAIDSNEISMHGTRVYPDLRNIANWIGKDNDNAKQSLNWKKALMKKSNRNLVKEFLFQYRQNITELD